MATHLFDYAKDQILNMQTNIQGAIELAAYDLPAGYTIHLGIENGAAWVDLTRGGHGVDIDGADMTLAEQIDFAVSLAKKGVLMSDSEKLSALQKGMDDLEEMMKELDNKMLDKTDRWRPMVTAPTDGRNILAVKNGVITTVRWLSVEKYWTLCVPGTFTLYHDWDPEMWMPLPDPPKK